LKIVFFQFRLVLHLILLPMKLNIPPTNLNTNDKMVVLTVFFGHCRWWRTFATVPATAAINSEKVIFFTTLIPTPMIYVAGGRRMRPNISEITKSIKKTTNNIFTIPADAAAAPENPSAAAIIDTTRNITAQVNIGHSFDLGHCYKLQLSYLIFSPYPLGPPKSRCLHLLIRKAVHYLNISELYLSSKKFKTFNK
jgi:hypothetical protein